MRENDTSCKSFSVNICVFKNKNQNYIKMLMNVNCYDYKNKDQVYILYPNKRIKTHSK